MEDPFVSGTPAGAPPQRESHRYSTFDTQLFSLNASSPAQIKRALEAHLSETERRLQDASNLGTALVNQQKELSDKLKEVEQQQEEGEIGPDLREKLADLEREYNEIGRESARASLGPKSRPMAADEQGQSTPALDSRFPASPSVFSSQASNSPSKVTVPSRKQRNQPSSRVHDIEFATEISTSLLAQVRQLQTSLAEREQSLKDVTLEKSRLELEAEGFTQRLRALDESEQRYKDENWSLETQTHELMAAAKESSAREDRLTSSLNALNSEKNKMQRELDELRQSNGKLIEDHTAAQKSHDTEIHILRRNISLGDGERAGLQQKVEELTGQNQELAKAVAAKPRQRELGPAWDTQQEDEDDEKDDKTPENSPPPSPNKQTPRHNHLESETLKSSLHHAHRMIQNLKNNIHREKTEKLDLKRMLQDARDEVEQRRSEPTTSAPAKRPKTKNDAFKKPPRPEKLGESRREVTNVEIDEPDWEDQTGEVSPTREQSSRFGRGHSRNDSTGTSDIYQTASEVSDAFETANERETATESEAFQTGVESFAESTDELTETEERTPQSGTVRTKKRVPAQLTSKAGDRTSFMSTASTSADEADYNTVRTPVQAQPPRYRLKLNRGRSAQSSFDAAAESPRYSPATFNSPPQRTASGGQSLFAELDGLASGGESEFGTPGPESQVGSPIVQRSFDTMPPARQLLMVDSGMMTDPWEPMATPAAPTQEPVADAAEERDETELVDSGTQYTPVKSSTAKSEPAVMLDTPPKMAWDKTDKERPETADSEPSVPVPVEPLQLEFSPIFSEITVPVSPPTPRPVIAQPPVELSVSGVTSAATVPSAPAVSAPTVRGSPELTISDIPGVTTEPVVSLSPAPIVASLSQPLFLELSSLQTQETRPLTPVVTRPSLTPQSVVLYPDSGVEGSPGTPRKDARGNTAAAETQTEQHLRQLTRDVGVDAGPNGAPAASKSSTCAAQTILTGSQIDQLLVSRPPSRPISSQENKESSSPFATPKAKSTPAGPSPVLSKDGSRSSPVQTKRPGSAGSQRRTSVSHPPLPTGHKQAIAAAKVSTDMTTPGSMGPPIAPASAYRTSMPPPPRPRSPSVASRTKARNASQMSHRASVSSFASELEGRFGIAPPEDAFDQGSDPRMIQAITQTMVGEFLWKYTRKAGRADMSNTRHRRYFWVHPYTRTLYWSAHNPQSPGKSQHKSKSVAIEAVRVVTDDNPFPPGLHRKSLEIVTPSRVVKFTASTSQRHETWFNALSYLLLRTDEDAEDQGNHDDANEFDPNRRVDSRMSISSHHSRTAQTLSRNYVQNTLRARQTTTPSMKSPSLSSSRPESNHRTDRQGSTSRLSNMFRNSPVLSTFSTRKGRHSAARASVDSVSEASRDSAEDLRRVMQRQEMEADRLENVRACCDGKHDVSSLSRTSRYSSKVRHPSHVHA